MSGIEVVHINEMDTEQLQAAANDLLQVAQTSLELQEQMRSVRHLGHLMVSFQDADTAYETMQMARYDSHTAQPRAAVIMESGSNHSFGYAEADPNRAAVELRRIARHVGSLANHHSFLERAEAIEGSRITAWTDLSRPDAEEELGILYAGIRTDRYGRQQPAWAIEASAHKRRPQMNTYHRSLVSAGYTPSAHAEFDFGPTRWPDSFPGTLYVAN